MLQRQILPKVVQKRRKKSICNNIVPHSVVLGTEGSTVWENDGGTRSVTPLLVFTTCPQSGTPSVVTSTASHTRASSTSGRQSSTQVSRLSFESAAVTNTIQHTCAFIPTLYHRFYLPTQSAPVNCTAVRSMNISLRRCATPSLTGRPVMKATKAEIYASTASVRYQSNAHECCSPQFWSCFLSWYAEFRIDCCMFRCLFHFCFVTHAVNEVGPHLVFSAGECCTFDILADNKYVD